MGSHDKQRFNIADAMGVYQYRSVRESITTLIPQGFC
jgi:hypothetical protein